LAEGRARYATVKTGDGRVSNIGCRTRKISYRVKIIGCLMGRITYGKGRKLVERTAKAAGPEG
jgi:hypothetical protein